MAHRLSQAPLFEDVGLLRDADLQAALSDVRRLSKRVRKHAAERRQLAEAKARAARLALGVLRPSDLGREMGVRKGTASKLLRGAEVERSHAHLLGPHAKELTLYDWYELGRLADETDVVRFARAACDEGWNQDELQRRVQKQRGRQRPTPARCSKSELKRVQSILKAELSFWQVEMTGPIARVVQKLRGVSAETIDAIAQGEC
jgi:hypothetical protein